MIFQNFLSLLRVKHWIKNLFVFVPIFISGNFFEITLLHNSLLGFIVFSFASSSIYIFNDLIDIERDRNHHVKKNRPLASGAISKKTAVFSIIFLLASIYVIFGYINYVGIEVVIGYLLLNVLYTFYLKHIVILDVMSISSGFVLRVMLGVMISNLELSQWLIALTFSLCMLLALGKRRAELKLENSNTSRPALNQYNLDLISSLQVIFVCITIMFYMMYTIFNNNFPGNTELLFYSSIFVIAGLARYMAIATSESMIDEPTNIVYQDHFILITVLSWISYIFFCLNF
tara:strand:- start:5567 stop:6430 length:864 start_codon:yes stop_codon:yes gene_type:complete